MSCPLVKASSISADDTKAFLHLNSTKILYFPGIISYLYVRREPADLHQFSVTDTSNSRRPRDCLFRHLHTALVLPPPSITPSGFWPIGPRWQLLCYVHVRESNEFWEYVVLGKKLSVFNVKYNLEPRKKKHSDVSFIILFKVLDWKGSLSCIFLDLM